jgi:hypothetical protein
MMGGGGAPPMFRKGGKVAFEGSKFDVERKGAPEGSAADRALDKNRWRQRATTREARSVRRLMGKVQKCLDEKPRFRSTIPRG